MKDLNIEIYGAFLQITYVVPENQGNYECFGILPSGKEYVAVAELIVTSECLINKIARKN